MTELRQGSSRRAKEAGEQQPRDRPLPRWDMAAARTACLGPEGKLGPRHQCLSSVQPHLHPPTYPGIPTCPSSKKLTSPQPPLPPTQYQVSALAHSSTHSLLLLASTEVCPYLCIPHVC